MEYSDAVIQQVWEKGRGTNDQDPIEWRKDACGAWIHRTQYNSPKSEFGWKILSTSPEGLDRIEQLEPFHYRNAFDIANGKPHCHVTADRTGVLPTARIDTPRNKLD